jgi:ferredoxin
MSVDIRFEPTGHHGIVAEGSYLWDAAKRLGVRLPAECEGRGECDTCAVIVKTGATLLSALTEAERERLSPERLAGGERLACQTRVLHGGELVLQPVPVTEREETAEEVVGDFRKEFRDMPLKQKLTTLVEFEAVTAYETLSEIANFPYTVGERLMDFVAGFGRSKSKRDRDVRRPVEHRPTEPTNSTAESKE